MNRRLVIAGIVLVGLALSALIWVPLLLPKAQSTSALPTPETTSRPPMFHDVRIAVHDAQSSTPITAAGVSLNSYTGSTNELGVYRINVPHGQFVLLHVQAPGYEPWQGQVDTTETTQVQLTVQVPLAPNRVRGQVVNQQLAPLPQAQVTFRGEIIPLNEEARFELSQVIAGELVTATHPGYVQKETASDGGPSLYLVLEPVLVRVRVQDTMLGAWVPDVSVCAGDRCQVTGADGTTVFQAIDANTTFTAERPGYQTAGATWTLGEELVVELTPTALHGYIRDAETGRPITRTIVLVDDQILPLDDKGMYHLEDLSQVHEIFVKAPGYERVSIPVGPETRATLYNALDACAQAEMMPCADINLAPFPIKGLYASYNLLMWDKPRLLSMIDLIDRSPDLNAIVVDIKGDFGYLAFESDHPLLTQVGAMSVARLPVEELLRICKEKHIYTVARMVIFKDSPLIAARPELAVHHPNGAIFYDREGMAWADPTLTEVWDYNIAITLEAIRLGFDEVQYDYVRYPSDSTSLAVVRALVYSIPSTLESRTQAIQGFVKAAKAAVDPTRAFLSLDIFGYSLVIAPDHDMRIGQRLIDLAPYVDYLCPMIYPSTFQSGNLDLVNPSAEPYKVIQLSMDLAARRVPDTVVRPWLQHYWYGRYEIAEQRRAAEEATDVGWCFWNARGTYDEMLFLSPQGITP